MKRTGIRRLRGRLFQRRTSKVGIEPTKKNEMTLTINPLSRKSAEHSPKPEDSPRPEDIRRTKPVKRSNSTKKNGLFGWLFKKGSKDDAYKSILPSSGGRKTRRKQSKYI